MFNPLKKANKVVDDAKDPKKVNAGAQRQLDKQRLRAIEQQRSRHKKKRWPESASDNSIGLLVDTSRATHRVING